MWCTGPIQCDSCRDFLPGTRPLDCVESEWVTEIKFGGAREVLILSQLCLPLFCFGPFPPSLAYRAQRDLTFELKESENGGTSSSSGSLWEHFGSTLKAFWGDFELTPKAFGVELTLEAPREHSESTFEELWKQFRAQF